MNRQLNFALNGYSVIPSSLRETPALNVPANKTEIDLASLYHHYYLDTYGTAPPSPDPSQFEYVRFLLPSSDLRFQRSGLGIAPAAKRHRSTELGQAFCRWFLYEHFNITYFAHMSSVLDRQLHRAFEGLTVERQKQGDAPDYFCAERVDRVFLAEAKGRYSAINFRRKEFARWREQFDRVVVKDASGNAVTIKGHIVATRFATEDDAPRIKTCLFAEDPDSPGSRPPTEHESASLSSTIMALHYSVIADKLRQPLLAVSLRNSAPMPRELRILAVPWRVVLGPLMGRRFVGGYFPGPHGEPLVVREKDRFVIQSRNPLRLDSPSATFFGLEEGVFRELVSTVRSETPAVSLQRLQPLEETPFFYSGFSVLRDGSAIGSIEFFAPDEPLAL